MAYFDNGGPMSSLTKTESSTMLTIWDITARSAGSSAVEGIGTGPLLAGTAAAAASGVVALLVLLSVVRRGRIHWFAAYCLPVGLIMAVVGLRS